MVKLDVSVTPAANNGVTVTTSLLRADNATPDEEWMAREIMRHITVDVVRDAVLKLQGFREQRAQAAAGLVVGEAMTAEEVAAAGLPPLDAHDGEG